MTNDEDGLVPFDVLCSVFGVWLLSSDFWLLTSDLWRRAPSFSFPIPLKLISIAPVRGLYRKERTDHGRQLASVAFSVVPKLDNRVRVAEDPPSSTGIRRTPSRVKGEPFLYATARLLGLPGGTFCQKMS